MFLGAHPRPAPKVAELHHQKLRCAELCRVVPRCAASRRVTTRHDANYGCKTCIILLLGGTLGVPIIRKLIWKVSEGMFG